MAPIISKVVGQARKVSPAKASSSLKPTPFKKTTMKKGGTNHRICTGLAELLAIGMEEPPRSQVAIMAGYPSADSAGFKKAVGEAKKAGLVDYPANKSNLRLAQAGRDSVPVVHPPQNNAEMLDRLKAVLAKTKAPKKTAQVLDLLSDGEERTLAAIAKYTDYPSHTTAGFKKFIGSISSLGFIDRPTKGVDGTAKLSDIAFPYPRGSDSTSGQYHDDYWVTTLFENAAV